MATISIYPNVKDTKSTKTVLLNIFLDAIQSGKWQDQVFKIRTIEDIELRRAEKAKLPNVTISGVFSERTDKGCISHSGFIAIDLDDLGNEVESTRELLKTDPYVYSCFTSVSGKGLCVLIKIDGERHRDAFDAISDYLVKQYQIVCDPTGINPSRTRFVSYDTDLFINENSAKFKKYLPKEKKRKIESTIFVQTEFDEVIKQMVDKNVSCCDDYRDWRNTAFGLYNQFGNQGRKYFEALSKCSDKYDEKAVADMYDAAGNRGNWHGEKITIATIYWFAKQAGINIYSEQTKKVAAVTSTMKKAGLDRDSIKRNLEQFEGIKNADDIIKQAFESNANFTPGESIVENVRMWIRHNFNIKRNKITRKIEVDGDPQEDIDFNTMFLDAKILFPDLSSEIFMKILFSHNTPTYNPITDFINSIEWDKEPRLDNLGACINSNTGTIEWRCAMARKWYIGIISSVYGIVNELNFIIVGAKNTGKTKFFTLLLPDELQTYFGRSQLNRGTDDEILMCEKLIILNDEYGGKNRADERTEKRMMAAPMFSLRVPYGRGNEDVVRIASLCGTCNETNPLDDATGNRRIIVMESIGKFNFSLYNSLDKYQLLAEALQAFKNGELPELNESEITQLEANTDGQYSKVSFEQEMIVKYFTPPAKTNPWDFMTSTEIKLYLESHTKEKININKLGGQLKKLGYNRRADGARYGYDIAPFPPIVVTVNG